MNGLRWAVRESFLRYVSALPDGRIRASGGVTVVDGFHFLFPPAAAAEGQPGAPGEVHRFSGEVEFTGHLGLLRVGIRDPWIEQDGSGAVVTVAQQGARLTVATCRVTRSPGDGLLVGRDVRLTEDGAGLFGGSYEAGGELESFVAATVPPRSARGAPAPTGA